MTDKTGTFAWPREHRAALSITFDDARASQLEVGLPILDATGVAATFYVMMRNVESREAAWKQAAAGGHEIGHHSLRHACSVNFPFAKDNPLEDYTLQQMAGELDEASAAIANCFGAGPTSFAYPCGMSWIGRGLDRRSYVPLIAERFVAGRVAFSEWHNDPRRCDPAALFSMDMDGTSLDRLQAWLERAVEERGWLILTAHDVAEKKAQAVGPRVLEAFCRHAGDRGDVWVDTVTPIARHIRAHRRPGDVAAV